MYIFNWCEYKKVKRPQNHNDREGEIKNLRIHETEPGAHDVSSVYGIVYGIVYSIVYSRVYRIEYSTVYGIGYSTVYNIVYSTIYSIVYSTDYTI